MNKLLQQVTLLVLIPSTSWGAVIQKKIPASTPRCYLFSMTSADVKVAFPPGISTPEIQINLPTTTTILESPDHPVLDVVELENGCQSVVWKPVMLKSGDRKPTDWTISLPANARRVELLVLSGRISGPGANAGNPGLDMKLQIDRGDISWKGGTYRRLETIQTQGALDLSMISSPIRVIGENVRAQISDYNSPTSEAALASVSESPGSEPSKVVVKHGQVTLQNIHRPLEIITITADVISDKATQELQIMTETGSIQSRDAQAPQSLETDSGQITATVTSSVAGTTHLTTRSGTIEMRLKESIDALVEAEPSSLPMDSEFKGTIKGTKMFVPLNAQTHRIVAKAVAGPIVIKKF